MKSNKTNTIIIKKKKKNVLEYSIFNRIEGPLFWFQVRPRLFRRFQCLSIYPCRLDQLTWGSGRIRSILSPILPPFVNCFLPVRIKINIPTWPIVFWSQNRLYTVLNVTVREVTEWLQRFEYFPMSRGFVLIVYEGVRYLFRLNQNSDFQVEMMSGLQPSDSCSSNSTFLPLLV